MVAKSSTGLNYSDLFPRHAENYPNYHNDPHYETLGSSTNDSSWDLIGPIHFFATLLKSWCTVLSVHIECTRGNALQFIQNAYFECTPFTTWEYRNWFHTLFGKAIRGPIDNHYEESILSLTYTSPLCWTLAVFTEVQISKFCAQSMQRMKICFTQYHSRIMGHSSLEDTNFRMHPSSLQSPKSNPPDTKPAIY